MTGADTVIVVMSGNFVQRGAPAIMPKHLRAKVALKSGASLVLELPVCFATGSAEYFAQGAVALLDSLGCVDACVSGANVEIFSHSPGSLKCSPMSLKNTGLSFVLRSKRGFPFHLPENGSAGLSSRSCPVPDFGKPEQYTGSGIHQSTDPAGKHNPALYHSPERLPVSC